MLPGLGSDTSRNVTVPYMAMLMRSQGKSDTSISTALRQDGYSSAEIAQILQQMSADRSGRYQTNKKTCAEHTGAVPARGVLHMLFLAENNGVLFESHWDTPTK